MCYYKPLTTTRKYEILQNYLVIVIFDFIVSRKKNRCCFSKLLKTSESQYVNIDLKKVLLRRTIYTSYTQLLSYCHKQQMHNLRLKLCEEKYCQKNYAPSLQDEGK